MIDSLFRHTTHTWSPTWIGGGGNPTLGSGGFVEGKYLRPFPRMVFGYARLNAGGAGFLPGSSVYRLSMPPAAPIDTNLSGMINDVAIGKAYIHDDDNIASSTVMGVMYDVANNVIFFRKHSGDVWQATTPFTMAQNDRMSCYFMYATAAV